MGLALTGVSRTGRRDGRLDGLTGRRVRQAQDLYARRLEHRLRLRRDALVVGEKQHLNVIGQPMQDSKSCLGPVVVEVDEQVVEDQREMPILLDEMLKGVKTQREVQLISRTGTETRDVELRALSRWPTQ